MSAKPTAKDSVKETKNFLSRDAESCNIDETVQSHLEEYADMSPSMAHIMGNEICCWWGWDAWMCRDCRVVDEKQTLTKNIHKERDLWESKNLVGVFITLQKSYTLRAHAHFSDFKEVMRQKIQVDNIIIQSATGIT